MCPYCDSLPLVHYTEDSDRQAQPNRCYLKLRMNADGWDGLCTTRTEPSPNYAHGPWDNALRNMPVLERKDDGTVNGHGEAAVSPSEHDQTHYELGEWAKRARERVIGLAYYR